MTQFNSSDWDFGEQTNNKLRDVFKITGRIVDSRADDFIEFLINDTDVDALVSMVLYWAPKERIESLARDNGFLDEQEHTK